MLPPGFSIGHQVDKALNTGVTVILPDQPTIASYRVMGGSPGTRETDLLVPSQSVNHIDALVFSGGSAFGLDAATGAQAWLRERGRGFPATPFRIPIVPSAILFDLRTGNLNEWPKYPPYRDLAYAACDAATPQPELGLAGAGIGATTATALGGFGVATATLVGDICISAAVCCNAAGSPLVGDTNHFWAAPFEVENEFGGRGYPHPFPANASQVRTKSGFKPGSTGENTTLAAVMTNAALDAAACERISTVAHDGYARALYPVHTPADGDVIFTLASHESSGDVDLNALGVAAANVVSRAIAIAVYHANEYLQK